MTIRQHAEQLANEECEGLCAERAKQGFSRPNILNPGDERIIKRNVLARLKESGKYGSIQLWWFAFTILLEVVKLIIARRNLGAAKASEFPLLPRGGAT